MDCCYYYESTLFGLNEKFKMLSYLSYDIKFSSTLPLCTDVVGMKCKADLLLMSYEVIKPKLAPATTIEKKVV
ncbi:hypothetical protein Tco_0199392 [Tanacetum coccineum]